MANPLEKWFDRKATNPFRDLAQVHDSFDRLYNEFMNSKKLGALQEFVFNPSCEISEEGNNYLLKFDLPGVTKDRVHVEADKDQLTVRAERKEEKKSETKKKYLSEVQYGSYVRSFTMPGPVDEKKIEAKFENGVLTVTVPKTETSKSKQIAVN